MIDDEIQAMADGIPAGIKQVLSDTAEKMAKSMQKRLQDGGHIDTGALFNSLRSETHEDGKYIDAYVIGDAKSPQGTWYAEFLEFGTGVYNEDGNGRQTPWKYKDRAGNWHTTEGMKPDPFIRPSVAEHLAGLEEDISVEMDLRRYKR